MLLSVYLVISYLLIGYTLFKNRDLESITFLDVILFLCSPIVLILSLAISFYSWVEKKDKNLN